MIDIEQEERVTIKEKMSREGGFWGVSLLHRLYTLYKFDVIKDLVFDVMHLVPLNLVKRRFEHLLSNSLLDTEEFQAALEKVSWTQSMVPLVLLLFFLNSYLPQPGQRIYTVQFVYMARTFSVLTFSTFIQFL